MPEQDTVDTERAVVTTYVPAYQKDAWADHAENLGMSQSEFVRSMVQAGRRGFGANTVEPGGETGDEDVKPGEPSFDAKKSGKKKRSSGSNPRGNIRKTVLQTLEDQGPLSWEELVEEVIGDLEDELEVAVMNLLDSNQITNHPRSGKYEIKEA